MVVGLQVTKEETAERAVLRLSGRLDASSALVLERELEAQIKSKRGKIYLDCGRLEYLSSAGMRLLLSATKQLEAAGRKFALFSLGDEVMEIIKMAGFERILHIYASEQEALRTL